MNCKVIKIVNKKNTSTKTARLRKQVLKWPDKDS